MHRFALVLVLVALIAAPAPTHAYASALPAHATATAELFEVDQVDQGDLVADEEDAAPADERPPQDGCSFGDPRSRFPDGCWSTVG